jgi:metal-responsive CopG/Arc/MetJ family transcriptional regulator
MLDTRTRVRICFGIIAVKTLNLTFEKELIEEIKIQAVREGRSVSEIARQLFREYLERQKRMKSKKNKQ